MIEIITHPLIVTAFTVGGLLTLALIIAVKQDNKNRQTLTNESSRPNKERDLLLLPNTTPDTRRNRRTSQTGLEQPERIKEIEERVKNTEERLIKVETKINYSIVLQVGIFLTALGHCFWITPILITQQHHNKRLKSLYRSILISPELPIVSYKSMMLFCTLLLHVNLRTASL